VNVAADDAHDADDVSATAILDFLLGRSTGATHPAVAEFLEDPELDEQLRALGRGGLREPDLASDERFLDDYELKQKVGGNMGTVYRADQISLPRKAAVKILLRGEEYRERFRKEAEAMARLQHPNIVRIWEVSQDARVPYFAMEWCPGGTLAARVADYRSNPIKAAVVVATIARAVHYAHRREILHRDLKPANILFDESDEPRVADFGLAVPVSGSVDAPAGTPPYMAPEQLEGEPTEATDVYGLGAILYELLTGRPPSAADTLTAVFDRVRAGNPEPPQRLNPAVVAKLDAVCQKSLAKDPAARYGSAVDMAVALEQYVQAEENSINIAPGLVGQAGFVFCSNAAVYTLLRAGAVELWVWLALFASYGPLFALLIREWWTGRTYKPVRRHMWSIWSGHAAASVAVFAAIRIAAGDLTRGIETGYVGCAGLNVLAFLVMGSFFGRRQYLLAGGWAITTVIMGMAPTYAPLLYGVVMAVCTGFSWWQFKHLRHDWIAPRKAIRVTPSYALMGGSS
jgi:serine/threonine-protein kinase